MAVNPSTPVYGTMTPTDMAAVVDVDINVLEPNRPTRTSAKALVMKIAGNIDNTAPLQVAVVSGGGGGGAVTIADGADVAQGTTTNIAYTDATGAASGTLLAVLKGIFVKLANSLGVSQPDISATGTINPVTLNAAYTVALSNGRGVVGFTVTGLTASGGAVLTIETSNDGGTTWTAANGLQGSTGLLFTTLSTDTQFRVNVGGRRNVRLRVSTVGTTGTITVASNATVAGTEIAMSSPLPPGVNIIGKVGIDQTTPGTTNGTVPNGNVASGVADSGNPIKIGGVVNTGTPSVGAAGQRKDLWMGVFGNPISGNYTVNSAGADANTLVGFLISQTGVGMPTSIANYIFNGTTFDRQRGDVNGIVVQSGLSTTFWNYSAASGGITNSTTGITVKAAAGAGVRNYIKSLQLTSDTLATATTFVIRDGASGTVLARIRVGTGGISASGTTIFDPPLRGSANTLVEIATETASATGGVYANIQGFTGT